LAEEVKLHLKDCPECGDLYRKISEMLDSASEVCVPHRSADYGLQVWSRVLPLLPASTPNTAHPRSMPAKLWLFAPACAALLAVVFLAGMWTERALTPPVIAPKMPIVDVSQQRLLPQPTSSAVAVKRHHAQISSVQRPNKPGQFAKPPQPAKLVLPSDAEQDARLLALNNQLQQDEKAAMPLLLGMINGDTSDRTKEHALFVLAQSDSQAAHQALLDFARQSSNSGLQTKALSMITRMRQMSSDVEPRHMALRQYTGLSTQVQMSPWYQPGAPDEEKKQILTSVFQAGDAHVLLDILQREKDPGVRVATIRSLGVLGENSAALANVYRADTDQSVRLAVLDALLAQQNSRALQDLVRAEVDVQRKAEIQRRLDAIPAH
jgi:hypothetical protein